MTVEQQQLEYGSVTEVSEQLAGDELAADVVAGALELQLYDAVDFDEAGGLLALDDGAEVVAYSSADLDADTITLAAPLAAGYPEATPVRPSPDVVERRALVQLDVDGEAIDARVPHALFDRLELGTRSGVYERVSLSLDGAEWVVEDLLGQQPVVDGSYIDPGTLPQTSDGFPPGGSPTVSIVPLYATLLARWPMLENADAVTYDVLLAAPDRPEVLVATTSANVVQIGAEADGSPLRSGVTYSVRVHAFDADGYAPAPGTAGTGQLAGLTREQLQQAVQDELAAAQATATTAQQEADAASAAAATAQQEADAAAAQALAAANAAATADSKATTAQGTADSATTAASAADTKATAAQADADAAATAASAAQADAAAAQTQASSAVSAASAAQADADAAQTQASSAATTATAAQADADTALSTATDAASAASTADTKATAAQGAADSAATTASAADTKATAAQADADAAATTASAADSKATTAQGTADSAASAASAADAKATTADTKATTAQGTADTALSTANAKGKLIVQPTAPTGANATAANLWIDTSGTPPKNQPNRWDGSVWVPVTDKAATDAAAQAVAAQNAATAAQARADAAFTEATDAATAAGQAQESANGKNRVWYLGTPPAGTGHQVNDVWFDTANDNRPNRWDGPTNGWVQTPLGNAAIGNLDAAKITTGYLDVANRIETGSLGVDKLDAEVIVTNDFYALNSYLGEVRADQITTGTMDAEVTVSGLFQTATQGRRAVMDVEGIHLYDSAGNALVDLPTNPEQAAQFKGTAELQTTTIKDGLSLKVPLGPDGVTPSGKPAATLQPGATFSLANGVQPPGTPPTVSLFTKTLALTGLSSAGDDGVSWYPNAVTADASYFYAALGESNNVLRVQRWSRATGANAGIYLPALTTNQHDGSFTEQASLCGITILGGHYYIALLSQIAGPDTGIYSVIGYTDGTFSTRVRSDTLDYNCGGGSEQIIGISNDGTNLLVALLVCNRDAEWGTLRVRKVDPATGNVLATYNESTGRLFYNYAEDDVTQIPGGFVYGSLPGFAGARYFVYDRYVRTLRCYTLSGSSLLELTSESWPDAAPGGFGHDGQHFIQATSSAPKGGSLTMHTYSNEVIGQSEDSWHASYAWRRSSDGARTPPSPRTAFTMTPMRYVQVSGEAVPNFGSVGDPDAARHYVGRGSSDGYVAGDGTTVVLADPFPFAGEQPVTETGFSSGEASELRSGALRADQTPKNRVGADGSANLDGLVPPGSVQMFAGPITGNLGAQTSPPPTGWLFCNGDAVSRALYPDLFAAIGTAYGAGDGVSTFNLPDMRLRVPIGSTDATFAHLMTLGASDGRTSLAARGDSHAHNHSHGHSLGTGTSGSSHTHSIPGQTISSSGHEVQINSTSGKFAATQTAVDGHNHGGDTGTGGSTHTHNVTGSVSSETGLSNTQTTAHSWQTFHFIVKA